MTIITTVLLSCLACVGGLRIISPPNEAHDLSLVKHVTHVYLDNPMSQAEVDYLEASGQRAEMEQLLQEFQGKSFVFIGDSVIRNQYDGLCLLIGAKPTAGYMVKYDVSKCEGNGIFASFTMTDHPNPKALSELLATGIQEPFAIYWDASQAWARYKSQKGTNAFQLPVYRSLVGEAVQNFAKEAPNSKIVFFKGHSRSGTTPKSTSVDDKLMLQLNSICEEAMQANKDGQGRAIKIIDGFGFTKNRVGLTTDGVHYNKLVWEELKMMLNEIRQDPVAKVNTESAN